MKTISTKASDRDWIDHFDVRLEGEAVMKLSSREWFALSILFSATVIIIVFVTTFNEETIHYILNFNLVFLGLAIAFRMVALVFWGLRIQLMSRSLGYRVKLAHCINMVLAGLFAGTITPGQAGGEPVRIHELYRDDVKLGDAVSVVIMERILDGGILTVMGVILLTTIGRNLLSTFSLGLIILIIIAWIFMISFLIIPVLAIRYPEWTKKGLMRLVTWLVPKVSRWSASSDQIIRYADHEINNFLISMTRFTGAARSGLLFGGLMTACFWITEFMVASIILMGLGLGPNVIASFFLQILIAVINILPLTPGSSGVVELSASSLYALILPAGVIGIFVLLWRFVTFYLNIALGAIAGVNIFRREIDYRIPDIDAQKNDEHSVFPSTQKR
jgi:uncharacterized protein (TIRG00374 family)